MTTHGESPRPVPFGRLLLVKSRLLKPFTSMWLFQTEVIRNQVFAQETLSSLGGLVGVGSAETRTVTSLGPAIQLSVWITVADAIEAEALPHLPITIHPLTLPIGSKAK